MCGIAGIVHFDRSPIPAATLKALDLSLSHRGPDDHGFLTWAGSGPATASREAGILPLGWLGFVHRRLSILDLSETGWQPMFTPDGRYAIVFNGEIYNYLELRRELEKEGYSFTSTSDTEVLLKGFAHWGTAILNRLVGMFAFAILDMKERRLFLARDFFGIKPLYYTGWNGGFAFASEIKSLLLLPQVKAQANPQAVYEYLRFGQTDHNPATTFAGIFHLPPAHYLDISLDTQDSAEPVRYWQPEIRPDPGLSFEEAAVHLRELFLQNIAFHMRSDVPVGAALSGGIDSSSIVTAMRRLFGERLEIHSFSFIPSEPEINEERWVDLVGSAAGVLMHKSRPEPEELRADLERLIEAQDEPFGSTSIYAQHRVFRLAHETGIKVMLDGQGADELLAGYRPYLATRLASLVRRRRWSDTWQFLRLNAGRPENRPLMLRRRALEYLLPQRLRMTARNLAGRGSFPSWLNSAWFESRGVDSGGYISGQQRQNLKEQLIQELTQNSLPHLLRYEDRNSMAYSIESRVPFLTPAIADFVLSLPEEYIIAPDGTSKAVFRRAMEGIVPQAVLDRRDKIGFATPEKQWLASLQPWVESILESPRARSIPAFNLPAAKNEWQSLLAGQSTFDWRFWRWINFIRWAERFNVDFSR
jgi:asparagine synthase (glutamine-hydrolysing)